MYIVNCQQDMMYLAGCRRLTVVSLKSAFSSTIMYIVVRTSAFSDRIISFITNTRKVSESFLLSFEDSKLKVFFCVT